MSLTIGSSRLFANWDITRVRGEKGLGIHRLFIDLKLTGPGGPDNAVLTELELRVSCPGSGGGGYIARFSPADGPVTYPAPKHGWEHLVSVVTDLDATQVEAVENIRRGGNLTIKCHLSGRVSHGAEIHPIFDERQHEVNQGVWVRVLEQMGYGRILLLEVPVPEEEDAPRLIVPIRHLEEAQQAMLRGDWREAVNLCRKVTESLSTVLMSAATDSTEGPETPASGKTLSKEARFQRLGRTLYELSSLAAHADELAQGTEWERRDARAVVAAVTAIVSRYGSPRN